MFSYREKYTIMSIEYKQKETIAYLFFVHVMLDNLIVNNGFHHYISTHSVKTDAIHSLDITLYLYQQLNSWSGRSISEAHISFCFTNSMHIQLL